MVQLGYSDASSFASEPIAGDDIEAAMAMGDAQRRNVEGARSDSNMTSGGAPGDMEAQAGGGGGADRAMSLAQRHPHSRLLSTQNI